MGRPRRREVHAPAIPMAISLYCIDKYRVMEQYPEAPECGPASGGRWRYGDVKDGLLPFVDDQDASGGLLLDQDPGEESLEPACLRRGAAALPLVDHVEDGAGAAAFVRMTLAVLVQTKGFGSALCLAR